MSRKGSKNLTEYERNLLISVINDYEVCDLPDLKMIEILSQKVGRSIKESTYYSLKREAKEKRPTSQQWLTNFCKSDGLVNFYKQRFDETLFVQKELLKLYADEASKKDTDKKQNRALVSKLAKTISDNTKNLSELGMSPIILAKLQSLIPSEVLNGNLEYVEKYFEDMDKDQKLLLWNDSDDSRNVKNNAREEIRPDPSKAPTAILPPIDKKDIRKDGTSSETATSQGEQPIF
jgi:hypothetical protein